MTASEEKLLLRSILLSKKWAARLPVCRHCGDRAISQSWGICQDCCDELCGRTNGMRLLAGIGHKGIRVLNENDNSGLPGYRSVSAAQWDNVVNAYEEDR